EVQDIIDQFTPHAYIDSIHQKIDDKASEIILARYSANKQRNYNARFSELQEFVERTPEEEVRYSALLAEQSPSDAQQAEIMRLQIKRARTLAEEVEMQVIREAFWWVKSVRAAAASHRAAVSAVADAGDFPGVIGYDYLTGWPD
ncbi:MAG: hypothetical protein ACKO0Z_16685, partial [Betaproteobacteria bacterium]